MKYEFTEEIYNEVYNKFNQNIFFENVIYQKIIGTEKFFFNTPNITIKNENGIEEWILNWIPYYHFF